MTTEHASDEAHDGPEWSARLAVESARDELFAALLNSDPQMTAGQAHARTSDAVDAAYAAAADISRSEGSRLEATAQSISNQASALVEPLSPEY